MLGVISLIYCYDVMDEVKRLSPTDGRACSKAPGCFPSNDSSAELWHSTPVKMKNGGALLDVSKLSLLTSFNMDNREKQWTTSSPPFPLDTLCQDTKFHVNEPSGSTIQKQRKELQLLMAELKDRDRELNSMAASHHQQLHAWEQDRQRVLSLEQKCARSNDEVQKRNEVIRVLTKRVCVVETREEEVRKELSDARQQLCELEQKQQDISQKCEDFEEKNQSLNSTVMALSSQVGSLQVREEELSSMLKLKDKDVTEASGQIVDLTERLRDLETSLAESRSRESKLLRDAEENKRRYREAKHEITHLKEELQQQVTQSSTQREEIIRLKQEIQLLRRDLALTGEGDTWKDELLELARSKQERNMSELRCLRQVCENQRNDLQLLQLNLETLREKKSQGSAGGQDEFRCGFLEKHSPSSPSSLRLRNSRLLHETPQNAANGDQRISSAHLMDQGDEHLSSCFLQQLLDESRQVIKAGSDHSCSVLNHGQALSCDPHQSHECRTSQHHPNTSTYKDSETPPRTCSRHDAGQTWTT